jgi:hypothetical protein
MAPKPNTPETPEGGAAPFIVARDTAAENARALAADLKYFEDHPIDESKKPGGYFLNADGTGAHNSEGDPVPVMPEDVVHVAQLRERADKRSLAPAPVAEDPSAVDG